MGHGTRGVSKGRSRIVRLSRGGAGPTHSPTIDLRQIFRSGKGSVGRVEDPGGYGACLGEDCDRNFGETVFGK